jgi:hypothetical protein
VSETAISKAIREAVENVCGVPCFRVNSGGRIGRVKLAPSGTPDIYTHLGWLEVKRPGEELSEKQEAWHSKAKEFGVRVATVRSVQEAVATVSRWKAAREFERANGWI